MTDFSSVQQAEEHLEGEITERQKRLVQMCTEQRRYMSLSAEIEAKEVLENEIADRIAALKKLQAQRNCNCCEKELSALGFRIRLTHHKVRNGDLPETRVLIRVVCADCFGTFATRKEVDLAIDRLTATDCQRIKKFAARRMWILGAAGRGRTGEDLYGEAIRSTFEGAEAQGVGKRWNKAVDFVRHLTVAMRSISYRWRKEFEAEIAFECEAVTCGSDGQEYSLLDRFTSNDPAPDRFLMADEQVEQIVQRFENDDRVIRVLQGLSKGMTWPEIMQQYGLTEAAVKRIRMKLRRKDRSGSKLHILASQLRHARLRRCTTINASSKSALVVHDCKILLKLLALKLKQQGYTVRKACNSEEASRLYRQCGPFKVVVIDYDLPKEEGVTLAKRILKMNPSQWLIITAFDYASEGELRPPMELMHVPVLVGTLKSQLSKVLERLQDSPERCHGTAQSCAARSAGNSASALSSSPAGLGQTHQVNEADPEIADRGGEAPVAAKAELPSSTAGSETRASAEAC
jgi:CheY-like chemotaxis protein